MMSVKFKIEGGDAFGLPSDQLCTFVRNGRTIQCDVNRMIADYKRKQAELVNVSEIFKPDSNIDSEYAMRTDNNKYQTER